MILAGIDEAGLGPVLGPLVASAAAFRLAPDVEGDGAVDLWSRLGGCVSRDLRGARKTGRVAIGDSKKLYHRKKTDGLAPLERGVLAMWKNALGPEAPGKGNLTFAAFLESVAPGSTRQARAYPWYDACAQPLPRCVSPTALDLAANAVHVAMRAAGVEIVEMRCEPVLVEEFNRRLAATQNKSTTAFDVICRLLMYAWEHWGDDIRITVDRQGGRVRYRAPLQRVFAACTLKVVSETDEVSTYRIGQNGRRMEVSFVVNGERRSLPVALASMLSKYVRELYMDLFNGYWLGQVEGLRPTAGYYVDGRRFYRDIGPAMARLGVDSQWVYRSR